LFLGKEVPKVTRSFNDFWNHDLSVNIENIVEGNPETLNHPNRFDRLHEYACNPKNFWPQVRTRIENLPSTFASIQQQESLIWLDSVSFISDAPGKNAGNQGLSGGGVTTDQLIGLVKNATTSIDIQSPYLITTELSQGLFAEAVKRGVRVRILTNSLASTDNVEAFSSYQSSRAQLLATGVEIYEFRPDAAERNQMMTSVLNEKPEHQPIFGLHAKSMVIDGDITVIGTFNLDPRSANLNTECLFIIPSAKIAGGVLQGMTVEFEPQNSWRITTQFNPDSIVPTGKRVKTWSRKLLPKSIL
jgi:phosphatidylserine/phosphatidylglycerophosphate/cardiolipin synthase-like enzyme